MANIPFKIWLLAFRPKTLSAAVAPVLIGTAMAFGDGVHDFSAAVICLAAAIAIQIGTNLANDYYDFQKGADNRHRLGPARMTQAGLISPRQMKFAFINAFAMAAFLSLYLVYRGGWPIGLIAILAIISGVLYTAGPCALGYLGLGDFFVFIFFGPVAVSGTYYVQSYEMNYAVFLAGIAPGLLSVAILTVNNLRDLETDRLAGKRTLAVRFGRSFAVYEYLSVVTGAALMPVVIYALILDHIEILASSAIMLVSIPVLRVVASTPEHGRVDGSALNRALGLTGMILLIYSVMFSLGWIA